MRNRILATIAATVLLFAATITPAAAATPMTAASASCSMPAFIGWFSPGWGQFFWWHVAGERC